MTKIEITRSSELMNSLREFRIYLDGQRIGIILDGETKEFNVPNGKHNLQAKIDWCGSRNFDFLIDDNETKRFKISSGFKFGYLVIKYKKYLFAIWIGLLILHVVVHQLFGIMLIIWILTIPTLIFFLVIIYKLTIDRNKFLSINHLIEEL